MPPTATAVASLSGRPLTTDALVALYERTAPQLAALVAVVAPQALRRPDATIPDSTFEEARAILAAIRRLAGREPAGRALLELRAPVTWVALATRLALAGATLDAFRRANHAFDAETRTAYWRTLAQIQALPSVPEWEDEEDAEDD
jgi:hypothetical protein